MKTPGEVKRFLEAIQSVKGNQNRAQNSILILYPIAMGKLWLNV